MKKTITFLPSGTQTVSETSLIIVCHDCGQETGWASARNEKGQWLCSPCARSKDLERSPIVHISEPLEAIMAEIQAHRPAGGGR